MTTNTEAQARTQLHTRLLDVECNRQVAIASERRILSAAQDRLQRVQAEINTVRPYALNGKAGGYYLTLIQERGQLEQTIALAEQHLNYGW